MATAPTIAFNTANLVAQYCDWRFSMSEWGAAQALVVEHTTPEAWAATCRQIAACGYTAVELWQAHVGVVGHGDTEYDEARCDAASDGLRAAGLSAVGFGGPLSTGNIAACRRMGITMASGSYDAGGRERAVARMRESGILFNYENHPEKSVHEIRERVGHGAGGLAVALDTGWLGTQGVDAPAAVRALGRLIRHVHLKDVAAAGAHRTVRLGTGCVDIAGVVRELRAIGYDGVLSWEDEPEDRNVFDIAADMRQFIERLWRS